MSREQAREGGFGRRARAGEPRHHIVRLYSVMETVDEMVRERSFRRLLLAYRRGAVFGGFRRPLVPSGIVRGDHEE